MHTFDYLWDMSFGWVVPLLIVTVLFYVLKEKEKSSTTNIQDTVINRYFKTYFTF